MRYQGSSPDCMPLSNGKKPHVKICKKDENLENGKVLNGSHPGGFLEGKGVRLKGGSSTSNNHHNNKEHEYGNSALEIFQEKASEEGKISQENQALKSRVSEGGDLLLQWGQNKRSRGFRAECRNVVESSSVQARKIIHIDRRCGRSEKQTASAQAHLTVHSRSTTLRPGTPVREATTAGLINRNSEDPSASGNGAHHGNNGLLSEGRALNQKTDRHPPASPEKTDKAAACNLQTSWGLPDGMAVDTVPSETEAIANAEKVNLDLFEWPRIFISLSRKEKEDDFLVMKGTKLPQRPKKRAKIIDKTLQYCFPGSWLSDLTRGRYEVREKKCVKKKPRGLKAMESLDSDSD